MAAFFLILKTSKFTSYFLIFFLNLGGQMSLSAFYILILSKKAAAFWKKAAQKVLLFRFVLRGDTRAMLNNTLKLKQKHLLASL
jgi:hypothetical protein